MIAAEYLELTLADVLILHGSPRRPNAPVSVTAIERALRAFDQQMQVEQAVVDAEQREWLAQQIEALHP